MTLDDVANYCEFKDTAVFLGDPKVGFIRVNGAGVQRNVSNYGRFLAFNELAAMPSPQKVLEAATLFRIERGSESRTLTRQEFEEELEAFRQKLGI